MSYIPRFRDRDAERNWVGYKQLFPNRLGPSSPAEVVKRREDFITNAVADLHVAFMSRVLSGEVDQAAALTDKQIQAWRASAYGAKHMSVDEIRARERVMIVVARWQMKQDGTELQPTTAYGEVL